MNRNTQSHFAENPTSLDMSRSTFNRPQSIKTSFNVGDIIPFYLDEVLPGDTHTIKTSKVVRLQTLLTPFMDNIYLDTYYFFVPMRLTWEHTKEFFGENTKSAWIPQTEYQIPQVTAPDQGWQVGTIADYMGIPTGVPNISVSALPFRAYALIVNDWFRDQNLTDPLNIPFDDATTVGSNGTNYIEDIIKGGKPFKACKYFDYFTGALPSPQKGPAVNIGLSNNAVVGNGYALGLTDGTQQRTLYAYENDGSLRNAGVFGSLVGTNTSSGTGSRGKNIGVPTLDQLGDHPEYSGLVATGSMATINELRQAFQIQKFYEKCARGGTRYIELLKSMFGVTSPDARLQRPEYLGGNRVPIEVHSVVQNSQTSTTPQGTVTAMSVTVDNHDDFTHSFTEHGYIIGLCVARYDHTYQQGIERMWSRKSKFDFYWPLFANLGEQAIKNKEIYAQGSKAVNSSTNTAYDEEVFGYQEAWAEYRYKPNRVSGEMRSQYAQSLDSWHLADDYESLPKLSDAWIREDSGNVNRVIAVSDTLANQLFGDIYVDNRTTRCMPVYSIPGLIDHH